MFKLISAKWNGFWTRHDPDEVFSYDSFKMVTIRDRHLGILHHSLQTAIVLYIIVYVIFVSKQFLQRENAVGFARISLQPSSGTEFATYPPPPQCVGTDPQCIYPDVEDITSGDSTSLFIATLVNITKYSASCGENQSAPCLSKADPAQPKLDYFIANLANFSLVIDHSVVGANYKGKEPEGILQTLKGNNDAFTNEPEWEKCKKCTTPIHFKSNVADIIPLMTFLLAAKLNLEELANDYQSGESGYYPQTYREFGAVILLSINYDNSEHYWSTAPPITYKYRPQLIKNLEDYQTDTLYTAYPTNKTVINSKGIRILGVISGTLGRFTFQTLLIQLTTSIALLKVATTIVDLIAIHFLPAKRLYRDAKYQRTEGFTELKRQHKEMKSPSSLSASSSPPTSPPTSPPLSPASV